MVLRPGFSRGVLVSRGGGVLYGKVSLLWEGLSLIGVPSVEGICTLSALMGLFH